MPTTMMPSKVKLTKIVWHGDHFHITCSARGCRWSADRTTRNGAEHIAAQHRKSKRMLKGHGAKEAIGNGK
jgi:hypothetical protein